MNCRRHCYEYCVGIKGVGAVGLRRRYRATAARIGGVRQDGTAASIIILFYGTGLWLNFATQVVQKEAIIQELEDNFAALLQQSVSGGALRHAAVASRSIKQIDHLMQGRDSISAQEQLRQVQSACAAAEGKVTSLTQQNKQLQQQMRSLQVSSMPSSQQ